MKRLLIFITTVLMAFIPIQAQDASNTYVLLSGYVHDKVSQNAIADAEIHVPGTNIGVITNEDGFFSLKVAEMPEMLEVVAIGFRNYTCRLHNVKNKEKLEIQLTPNTTVLNNITVYSPINIIRVALQKIPINYSMFPEEFSTFYRETVRKKGRYVNLSEAVLNMYKSPYKEDITSDYVRIIKGRKLISQRSKDTLAIKIMGGPNEAIVLDLVKNQDYLLNEETLNKYTIGMEEGVMINDRPQYVISIQPRFSSEEALYRGKFYIDKEHLAFTRIEVSLDVSDVDKATRFMLVHKPRTLRFKPRELTTYVNYHYDGHYSRINYMRNVYSFNCDWKKKLFATNYMLVSEMVVTDHRPIAKIPSRKGAFRANDVLDSKVSDFNDPEFWESYNIIEPSESLEHAVKRLKKRAED